MISLQSAWAITLRHLRLLRCDTSLKLAHFYWPLLGILIWGFVGSWVQKLQGNGAHNYQTAILLGVLLWQITVRSAIITMRLFVEELLAQNVVNLFALPLSLVEWIIGMVAYNSIVMTMTMTFCVFVIYCVHSISIPYFISAICLFGPPLFLSGLTIGFISLAFIASSGKRAQEIGLVLSWVFGPFSTAFYPLKALPPWAQMISNCLPMSYVFEGMRQYIAHQHFMQYLIKGSLMSILYIAVAILLFIFSFNKSKQKGLARLTD